MSPKWIGFVVAPAVAVAFGIATGLSLGQDQEKKDKENETPLGKIMEKVQKHNIAITKATRNRRGFQEEPERRGEARERNGQARQGRKPLSKDYLKNAKNEPDPRRSGKRSWTRLQTPASSPMPPPRKAPTQKAVKASSRT